MIIENFRPFKGQHCETTATSTLLHQLDIELSEPLLFGFGEGPSYIYSLKLVENILLRKSIPLLKLLSLYQRYFDFHFCLYL
ncbi:BtrH N-terminal domain-containing protein [Niabella terrae]